MYVDAIHLIYSVIDFLILTCSQPANPRTNCHRRALLLLDHADLCSLLRDPDLQLIYSGRYQEIDQFTFPVVRHNYLQVEPRPY
jgi:hypothetical protein